MQTNELRLFVSSTFRDLMPEREVLVKKIFPKVRELCRQRGVYFTEIDLRWGITAEEARTGKVVRICLEEIDKCRPYFIGIMGSRYGWQPDEVVLTNDPDLAGDHPWLPELIAQGKSITEIEFLHGAILPSNTESAFIYDQVHKGEIDEENSTRLSRLKAEVSNANVNLRSFNSAEELGEQVLRDLTVILERDFPLSAEPTPLELERAPHDAFSINRRRSYVANPAYLARFNDHVASDDSPLVIWGRSGLGKSALMAYLTYEYKAKHPDSFVITHFVGAAPTGSDPEDVMRQVMMEIKDRYSLEDEIPTEEAKIAEDFPFWLTKVQDEKLILAIDAVNQLTGVAEEMHWLPEFIPPHVRLIISTTPGISLENLRKRGWHEFELLPLDEATRLRIAEEYLRSYRKSLTPDQATRIAQDPKCQSPLFLRTLLEELRVFGVFEEFESHLDNYLSSEDERDLFHKVLIRMETDHSQARVQDVMRAIWSSRYGLSENELLEITGIPRAYLSSVLVGLEYHLMKRSGLYTFFHNYLREAVETRYLSTTQAKQGSHAHLGRYFADTPAATRRRDEEPWQWMKAEDWDKYRTCLTDIAVISELLAEGQEHELLVYWLEFKKHFDLDSSYRSAFDEYEARETDRSRFAELSGKLGGALITSSHYKEAEYHIRKALEIRKKLFGEDAEQTADSMDDLAHLYYYQGKYGEASKLYLQVIQIRERVLGANDLKTIKAIGSISVAYLQLAKFDEAEKALYDVLERFRILFSTDHPEIASNLNNLGISQKYGGKIKEAIKTFNNSIRMYERLYAGGVCTGILSPIGNLALCLQEQKQYADAEGRYKEALALSKRIYGEYHNDVGFRLANLAFFYSSIGRYEEAISISQKAIEVREHVLGAVHNLTVLSYLNLGITYARMENRSESKKIYNKYFPLEKEMLGEDHPTVRKHREQYESLLQY